MFFRTFFGFLFTVFLTDCGASFLATESHFDGFSGGKNRVYAVNSAGNIAIVDDGDESQERPPRLKDLEGVRHKNSGSYSVYELKNGSEVLYINSAPDLKKQLRKHAGDNFTCMVMVEGNKTKNESLALREKLLKDYRSTHGGRLPQYNQKEM